MKFPDFSLNYSKISHSLIFPCRDFFFTVFPVFPVCQSAWPPCFSPDTVYYMELSQGEINQKPKNARVVFLAHDKSPPCDACPCKDSLIYSIRFRSYGPDTFNYMELSQGEIIQKPTRAPQAGQYTPVTQ